MTESLFPLGRTGIEISPIGLGCWQFSGGKGLAGRYWKALEQSLVTEIVRASFTNGVNWFDTAEAYGRGRSEDALSTALAAGDASGTVVATKWMPFFRFARSIGDTFPKRAHHLSPFPITLHQVHAPVSFSSIERQMDEMADLVESGAIRSVGVSNFSSQQTRRAHAALQRRGIPLASNQVRYSLLDRRIESNGLLDAARELGVTIIAYSPLEQGILTGRYHRDPQAVKRLRGPRRLLASFRRSGLERVRPLIDVLERVAESHDASPAQVSLAWLVRRHGSSVVAIPGASSVSQAESNAGAMRLVLSEAQLEEIDAVSSRVAG
jgi:aryl-alcohol dehydrogenase-like predicted oxidoreductase